MKRTVGIFVILLTASLLLGGCFPKAVKTDGNLVRPVEVTALSEETRDRVLCYVGTIISDDLVKYSYKSGGILKEVRVAKGDEVQRGAILARLDTGDISLAVNGARAQMEAAKAQYDKAIAGASDEDKQAAALNLQKAEDALDYANDQFSRMEQLYAAGAVSQADFEGVKLERSIREAELGQAQSLYDQAVGGAREEDIEAARALYQQSQTNYQYQSKQYREASLVSGIDGTVVEILFSEGELVGPGYPVVIVRSANQVINVGLSQKEVDQVAVGQHAMVTVGDQVVEGVVTLISEAPNMDTLTYDAEIALLEGDFRLGLVADVAIIVGDSTGIWIPIDAVMYSGEDFVYVVEEDTVVRKAITLGKSHGNMVQVSGLSAGDLMITVNAAEVKPGDKVSIAGE